MPSIPNYRALHEQMVNNVSVILPDPETLNGCSFSINNTQPQYDYKYIQYNTYVPGTFNYHKVNNEEELYMGIELEIDEGGKKDETAKLIIDSLGEQNVYCKSDGSLRNGIEIVTHPCTFEYHQTLSYEILFDELSRLGYRSHDVSTCGLHIHINRNYFAKDKLTQDLCISKLLYIFEKYWDKVALIARRNNCSYAKRFFLKEDESMLDIYVKSKNSDKYGVINLKHKNTVEIRIFKGTLNYRTFIATLQFVKHIINIIKEIDIYNIQQLTWEDIESKFSNNLVEYIKEREEINKKEKPKLTNNISFPTSTFSWDNVRGGDVIDTLNNFRQEYECLWCSSTYMGIDEMTTEQLKNKINELKRQIRSSRNPMEQRELQRELGRCSDRLGQLRRRS